MAGDSWSRPFATKPKVTRCTQRRPRFGFAVLAAGLTAAVLAGCGGGSGATERPTAGPAPKVTQGKSAPAGEVRQRRRPVPRCGPTDLVVTHHGLGGGALSTYGTTFDVVNISARACSAAGFPRVVALGVDGRAVGGPAGHGTSRPEGPPGPVTIKPSYEARFRATWSEDVYAAGKCSPRTVDRYRVTLPGAHRAQTVPFPYFGRCTNAATDRSFSVGRLEAQPVEDDLTGPPRLEAAKPGEALPRCPASELLVWDGPHRAGGVAAGTSYGRIEVANLSSSACEISGIPRMVAVDLHGRSLGPPIKESRYMPALRGGSPVRAARIGPHRSAIFTYSVADALAYGGTDGCEYKSAAGFDVTLPGASRPQYVPAPVRRCLNAPRDGQMSVGPIE